MIDYQTWCRIRQLYDQERLSAGQIARELKLSKKTVAKWIRRESYERPRKAARKSKLDPYKGQIIRWVHQHDLSARQIFERVREAGFSGGYTILTDFIRQVRPKRQTAFLTLHFAPAECAQVDWSSTGSMAVGSTRRRLSFFVMVLCHSRLMYVEFTLAEKQEHFLMCHRNALEYFGGVPEKVMVDNCKVAVLKRERAEPPLFHPRYLDLARYYGFRIEACGVAQPQTEGDGSKTPWGISKRTFCEDSSSLPSGPSIRPHSCGSTPSPMCAPMDRPAASRPKFLPRRKSTSSSPCRFTPMTQRSLHRCEPIPSSASSWRPIATPSRPVMPALPC